MSSELGSLLDGLFEEIAKDGKKDTETKKPAKFVGPADSLFAIDPEDAASIDVIATYYFARHRQKGLRDVEVRVKTYEKALKRGEPYQVYEVKMKCKCGAHIVHTDNGKFGYKACYHLKSFQRDRDKFLEHLHNEGHRDLQKKQVLLSGTSEYELSYWWDASKWMSIPM